MKSVWSSIEKPTFNTLAGNVKTDVLVIGGGICGILCVYMLGQAGVDCVLVESGEICAGVTSGTTAKLTVQHGLIYDAIIREYGLEKAGLYYESQNEALKLLKDLAKENRDDFESCSSFVYSLNNIEAIEKEVEALHKIGCPAIVCQDTELPFSVAGAVKIENQAIFHPLKFAYSIAKGLTIYENTKVLQLKSNVATTEKGTITAQKIIVATHFPFINTHGGYFLKMYQHRSYVLALENAQSLKDMYVDEAMDGLSFRQQGRWLLLGGGSHRTGHQGGGWEQLRRFAEQNYPRACEATRWATQDCMTLDAIPYIGRYSKTTNDLYVATGFNKWGMTSSMVSAMLLTDMICGRKNEYEELYSPARNMLHPQLAVNLLESFKGLFTPQKPRCTHMGCALKYNREEHSWDCPCHGSRFEADGRLIDNPATKDKNQ